MSLGEVPELQQGTGPPGLEDSQRPRLVVLLGQGDVLHCGVQALVQPVVQHQDVAAPLTREHDACQVPGGFTGDQRQLDERERLGEPAVGVEVPGLGELEHEAGPDVASL